MTGKEICLWRKIKLSPQSGRLFRQSKPIASSIGPLHLSLLPRLCQSRDSGIRRGIEKTAHHDDEGDGSDETPYEVVVHAQPTPGRRRGDTKSNKAKVNSLTLTLPILRM